MKKLNILLLAVIQVLFMSCSKSERDIAVISVSSLNGNVFPVRKNEEMHGGFSLLSAMIKDVKVKHGIPLEIIGNSNFIYGTKEAYFTNGNAVIDIMNELNFSCLVIGHREFYFGFPELEELSKTANFPFVSANIKMKDSAVPDFIKPYIILRDNKTALIGISTGKVLKANLEKDVGMITITDPAEAVKHYSALLRQTGIERIIVAGDFDCDENTASNLTREQIRNLFSLKEADMFLTTTENTKHCALARTRTILNCGINGFEAVSFRSGSKGFSDMETVSVNSSVLKPDPGLANKMSEINQMIIALTGKVLGTSDDDIPHSSGERFTSETHLGNLICDIMRVYARTDVFLMNSGKVRNGFKKGPVSLGDLYNIMPYEGNIVTVEMTGSQIIKVLESSCAFKMSKSFLQVSGLKFSMDSSKKPFERVVESSIIINGKPLDKSRLYSVSLTDYIFQGGDSYNEFTDMGIKMKKAHQKQMREIIKDHILTVSSIQAPENNRINDISKL